MIHVDKKNRLTVKADQFVQSLRLISRKLYMFLNERVLDSIEARRQHLFAIYVQQMFKRRGTKTRYSPAQTIGWLSWLAQQMMRQNQTIFLVENMQPEWLVNHSQRWLYKLLCRLIVGLFSGLLGGLLFGLFG